LLPFHSIDAPDDLVSLGKITRFHGRQGEVAVYPFTDTRDRFRDLKRVYLCDEARHITFVAHIENVRLHRGNVLLKFFEIDDIGGARLLSGYYVKRPKSECPHLPNGRYYIFDIIGLSAFSIDGTYLGEVTDVWLNAANDIFVICREGTELLIPAVREFVVKVDLEERKMIIKPVEGWIE
jgi:16S rRNA processing protein RimM